MKELQKAEETLAGMQKNNMFIPLGSWKPIVAGAFAGMAKQDWVVPGSRAYVAGVLRGANAQRLINPRAGAKPYKIAPSSHHPANRALHAVGIAMATKKPTLCILGSAAIANGSFYEALNIATLNQAPVIFLLIHQSLGTDAPVSVQGANPLGVAQAFSVSTFEINDVDTVEETVRTAREQNKPTLILVHLER